MTAVSAASAAYIVAGLLFILSLAGLSRHESAKVNDPESSLTMPMSCSLLSANTTRPIPDQKIAPEHIAHGSVLV